MSSSNETLYFLYGSETGNCESIAKRLHHEAVHSKGYPQAECMTLNQATTKKILEKQLVATGDDAAAAEKPNVCLVIVCSTSGEGEPPENAARFRRWLRNTKEGRLANLRFTVLALGDTNYNNFCAAGKFIDSKLNELGGRRFFPRGEADDGIGLELVVDPWTEDLWAALHGSAGSGAGSPPALGHEAYQPQGQRVDMAVALETAVVYANASQICATLALFMYERIVELGGTATLYPIQYLSPSTVRADTRIVLFVLCTDSDEHTLCKHCAAAPRQPPLGPFAPLLQPGGRVDGSTAVGGDPHGLTAWLSDPSIRFYSAVCVAPRQESVTQAAALAERVRALAGVCRLDALDRAKPDEASSVAVSDDDVRRWAEKVLDHLPGVTAATEAIHAAVDWFFDTRIGGAFREAYAADMGLLSLADGAATEGAYRDGDSRPSRRSVHRHYHEQFANSSGAGSAAGAGAVRAAGKAGSVGGGAGSSNGDADGLGVVTAKVGGRALPRDSKLLNEYNLTPVVFLYSGGPLVSQIAHDMNAGAAAHHLRSSVADLTNLGHTGFPRRATFVFIVGNTITKALGRLFKTLRSTTRELRSLSGVRFAILGIDEGTEQCQDQFNVCALSLERQLLSLEAMKVHCTGLADAEGPGGAEPVVRAWSANLWGAILSPTVSVAYLDAASPNVSPGRVPALPASDPMDPLTAGVQVPPARGWSAGVADTAAVGPTPHSRDLAALASFSASAGLRVSARAEVGVGRGEGVGAALLGGTGVPGADVQATAAVALAVDASAVSAGGSGLGVGAGGTVSDALAPALPLFPWDSVPLNRDIAHATPIVFLYSSSGMAKTMAMHAMGTARELGFPVTLLPYSRFDRVNFTETPNVVLFCESAPDGRLRGGRRFRQYLRSPAHAPDQLSSVRFAVLGLGSSPSGVVHPAFAWAGMLARLQASRVFPVAIMTSLSQLHALGIPWCECVLATLALKPPPGGSQVDGSGGRIAHAALPAAGATDLAGARGGSQPFEPIAGRPSDMSILFLYGSSTGLAEAIARDFHSTALERGYTSRIATLNDFARMDVASTDNLVIVCSSVGTNPGGYPDNARRFARRLHRRSSSEPLLDGARTHFAVLGLDNGFGVGRDEYGHPLPAPGAAREQDRFCKPARRMDGRLAELGCPRLCPLGCVDVSLVLADSVEAWRERLFVALGERAARLRSARASPPPTMTRTAAEESGGSPKTAPAAPRVVVAYAAPPDSAIPDIAAHLAQMIREASLGEVLRQPMDALTPPGYGSRYGIVLFVVASVPDGEYLPNGAAFLRLLRQKDTPVDLFSSMQYSVLAISGTNAQPFHLGRELDRRLEELGATRLFARGEAVDSFGLERSVERWTRGLLGTLASAHEAALEAALLAESVQHVNAAPPASLLQTHTDPGTAASDRATLAGRTRTSVADGDGIGAGYARSDAMTAVTAGEGSPAGRAVGHGDVSEAAIHSWRRLTANGVEEPVILVNLTVDPETTRWEPGQTVAIMPANDAAVVDALLRRLGTRADEPFHPLSIAGDAASAYPTSPLYTAVEFPLSCGTVLLRCVSLRLTRANKPLFALLQRAAAAEEDRSGLAKLLGALPLPADQPPMTVLDVLMAFPQVQVPFRHVVEHLSLLQPRVYSIASAASADPRTLALCFKVVRHGLCTNWMYDLCRWTDAPLSATGAGTAGEPVSQTMRQPNELVRARRRVCLRFSVRPPTEFRMPRDRLIPLMLIGPGTGVSPFRAFLQERDSWRREGVAVGVEAGEREVATSVAERAPLAPTGGGRPHGIVDLYFGCRRSTEDYLFAEELVAYERSGVLHSLNVAFSREPNSGAYWYGGCYVQDRLLEGAAGVAELLTQRGARVYVCGDADAMAREVHQCLIDIVQQHLCVSASESIAYVEGMMKSGRYVRDVWTVASTGSED